MKIPVIVEPVAGNGYVARNFGLGLEGHGATREEAVKSAYILLAEKVESGATFEQVDTSPDSNPLMKYAGMFKDDPDFEDVIDIMAENRRKMEEDPNVP
jgi:hypothetical protein